MSYIQMKEQHFKYLKETMDKLMDTLKIKMMNNQKELMNKKLKPSKEKQAL